LVIVPALAELFLNLIKAYGFDMVGGQLKFIICGAASVPPYLINEYHKLNVNFCPGYGLTEFANMVSGNTEGLRKPNSVGLLYPGQVAKVVNGELWLKGRNMLKEYYNEPEENKTAFEDGWFKTGDLVRFDEENFLYIVGRAKDVIVLSNGENVSPAYIESKINQLTFIQDSLVTESTNELGAQILQVEVVLRASVIRGLGLQGEELNKYVTEKVLSINNELLDYERFSKVVIRSEDFPRTPAMKIIRPKKVY
jgi:long-chain acyl-CoA synthetase